MKVSVTSPSVKVDAKDRVRWMKLEAQTEREQIQLADLAKAIETLGQYESLGNIPDDAEPSSLAFVLGEIEQRRVREQEALEKGCQFDGQNN